MSKPEYQPVQIDSSSQAGLKADLNRLKFQCKRGNLETELLLVAYIEKLVDKSAEQVRCFENLLTESDQDLFYWLLKKSIATQNSQQNTSKNQAYGGVPEQYQNLIADIRNNYLNSSR